MEARKRHDRLTNEDASSMHVQTKRSRSRNAKKKSEQTATEKQKSQFDVEIEDTKRRYQQCMSELLSAADEEGIRIQDVKVRRKERQLAKKNTPAIVSTEPSLSSPRSTSFLSFRPRSPEPRNRISNLLLHPVRNEDEGRRDTPENSKDKSSDILPHGTEAPSWRLHHGQSLSTVPVLVLVFLRAFIRDLVQMLLDTFSHIRNGIKSWLPILIPLSLLLDLAMYNFCLVPFATTFISGYCPPSNPISLQLICQIPYVQPLAFCQPRNEPLFASNGSAIASEIAVRMGKAFEETEKPMSAMVDVAFYMNSLSRNTHESYLAINDLIQVVIRSGKPGRGDAMTNLQSLRSNNDEVHKLLLSFSRAVERVVWYQKYKTEDTAEKLKSVVQPPCPGIIKAGRWLPITESQLFEIQDFFCPNSFHRLPQIVGSHVNFTQPALDLLAHRAEKLHDALVLSRDLIYKVRGFTSGYRLDLEAERAGIVLRRSSLSEILIHLHWASDDTEHVRRRKAALDLMEKGFYEAIKPLQFIADSVSTMSSYNKELQQQGEQMVKLLDGHAEQDRAEVGSRKEIATQLSHDLICISESMMVPVDRLRQMESQLRNGHLKMSTIGDEE